MRRGILAKIYQCETPPGRINNECKVKWGFVTAISEMKAKIRNTLFRVANNIPGCYLGKSSKANCAKLKTLQSMDQHVNWPEEKGTLKERRARLKLKKKMLYVNIRK